MHTALPGRINADFTAPASVDFAAEPWVPSPMHGVDRKMLDRVGLEVARATSIVRYAPNSFFSAHSHGGGEEILVLEGTFSDESGDYGPGSYLRNPPGSAHTPFSREGCVIFVKLWQMHGDESETIAIDAASRPPAQASDDGVSRTILFEDGRERVALETWAPSDIEKTIDTTGGLEILVVSGSLSHAGRTYGPWSWLRCAGGQALSAVSTSGCRLYVKTGHLETMAPLPV